MLDVRRLADFGREADPGVISSQFGHSQVVLVELPSIILETNDPKKCLQLTGLRFTGTYVVGTLGVVSDGNFWNAPFWFTLDSLQLFLDGLESMNRTLSGIASLRHPFNDRELRLVASDFGHVTVSGSVDQADVQRSNRFEFITDQTCLPGLVRCVRDLIRLSAPPN